MSSGNMTPEEHAAVVKIVQNVCSLITEIGVAIRENAKPDTRSYATALADGLRELTNE